MNNKFSIIIPTLQKNKEYLLSLIDVLIKDESVGEVIVIDNSLQGLNYENEKIRIIMPKKNIFVNPAWNLGVLEAKFENVGLLNDDIKIPDGFCSLVLSKLNEKTGILGMCEEEVINKKFSVDDCIEQSCQISLQEITFRPKDFGIAMFFQKSAFVEIPDDLKVFYGDDWIVYQAKKLGRKNYSIRGQKIHHYGQLSSNNFNDFVKRENKIYHNHILNFWQKLFYFEETCTHKIIRIFGLILSIKKKK